MNMLTPEDIKQIGEEMGKVIEQNISPQFEAIDERFDAIDRRFDAMDQRFDGIDRRFDRLEGKTNSLINVLREKNVITADDKLHILS